MLSPAVWWRVIFHAVVSVAGLGVRGLLGPRVGTSSGILPGSSCGCGGAPGSCTGGGISGLGLPGGIPGGGSVGVPGVAGGISGGSIGMNCSGWNGPERQLFTQRNVPVRNRES